MCTRTISSFSSAEDERAAAFEELSEQIEKHKRRGALIILGDFNSRLHGRREEEKEIIGPWICGLGVSRIEGRKGGTGRRQTETS